MRMLFALGLVGMFYNKNDFYSPNYSQENPRHKFQTDDSQPRHAKLFEDAYYNRFAAEKLMLQREAKIEALYRQQLVETERRLLAEIYFMAAIYAAAIYRYHLHHHFSSANRHWVRPRVWLREMEKTGHVV